MSKFTPGPWKMRKRDGLPHGDDAMLGWDWDWEDSEANNPQEPMRGIVAKEADARLIAAAPEMYQSLYELAFGTDIRDVPNKWERARALLARIDGEDDAQTPQD